MQSSLSPEQYAAVNHRSGPSLILGGPGTGKTVTLVSLIRELIEEEPPSFRILVLTSTKVTEQTIRHRLLDHSPELVDRVVVATFHSFCQDVLTDRGRSVGVDRPPTVVESPQDRQQLLYQALSRDPQFNSAMHKTRLSVSLSKWLEDIGRAKRNLAQPDALLPDLRYVYDIYESSLRSAGLIDADDLLALTYRLLLERPVTADFFRRQFRHICIHDGQNLNEVEYRLIKALCGKHYRNITMVADPNEAIYEWAGSNVTYLDQFQADFAPIVFHLTQNFRSAQQIVELANRLFPGITGVFPKSGEVRLFEARDEREEARHVRLTLEELLAVGHPEVEGTVTPVRCAVLAATNYALSTVEEELHRVGLPRYRRYSGGPSESGLMQSFELCLRLWLNPLDQLSLSKLAHLWRLHPHELSVHSESSDIMTALDTVSVKEGQRVVVAATHRATHDWPAGLLQALDLLEAHARTLRPNEAQAMVVADTKAWRRAYDEFMNSRYGRSPNLTAFLNQLPGHSSDPPNGVALLTIHAAKGLEFDVVFVVGLNEGVLPPRRSRGSALEEQKRLLYVAITRARRLLYLSYPLSRSFPWGNPRVMLPSRFLRDDLKLH